VLRRALGGLFLLLAVAAGGLGGLWAFMKAAGAEVDYCPRSDCTSGWYFAGALLAVAVAAAAVGVGLLRGKSRSQSVAR
jgi:hypothetical protein